jgi:hypothetical protein
VFVPMIFAPENFELITLDVSSFFSSLLFREIQKYWSVFFLIKTTHSFGHSYRTCNVCQSLSRWEYNTCELFGWCYSASGQGRWITLSRVLLSLSLLWDFFIIW